MKKILAGKKEEKLHDQTIGSQAVSKKNPRKILSLWKIATLLLTLSLLSACSAKGAEGTKTDDSKSADNKAASEDQTTQKQTDAYHKITPEKAKEMMDAGEVVIVDVRTKEEYDAGHVPGAILIPVETIGDEAPSELTDKDAKILVYCRSGRRSEQAAKALVGLSYTAVYDFGGIIDWPYEIEK